MIVLSNYLITDLLGRKNEKKKRAYKKMEGRRVPLYALFLLLF